MDKWIFIFQILTIFIIYINSENVSIYNISPVLEIDSNSNSDSPDSFGDMKYNENYKTVQIKVTGEISNLLNHNEIIGEGQVINGFKLEEGKSYVLSKVDQIKCRDTPAFHDEELNMDFYLDNCHSIFYPCANGIDFVSADFDIYVGDPFEILNSVCDKITENNRNLSKRSDTFTCLGVAFTTITNIVALGAGVIFAEGYPAFLLALASEVTGTMDSVSDMVSACGMNVDKTKYCKIYKMEHSGLGYGYGVNHPVYKYNTDTEIW